MRFSESPPSIEWLDQFDAADRSDAIMLLDRLLLVGMDAMIDDVRSLILIQAGQVDGAVGLFVERELRTYKGRPKPLFKEMKVVGETRIRALGDGPKPIASATPGDPQVGSEGILAWLITELCRENPQKFVSHPGPDEIRNRRVRGFFLVTDFIGSGKRASTYLTAAWRVRSVKSWWSGKQIRFEIISYSGTKRGVRFVEDHPVRPRVSIVSACPTIDDAFPKSAARIRTLCERYDPISSDPVQSLGFGGTGALIAFAHGCPNNVPRIFFRKNRRSSWVPLFGARVTALSRKHFPTAGKSVLNFQDKFLQLGSKRLADSPWLSRLTQDGRVMLLVLAAVRRGPRFDFALSQRTGITIPEITSALAAALSLGWVDDHRRLSDSGLNELEQASQRERRRPPLFNRSMSLYIPKSLRMP